MIFFLISKLNITILDARFVDSAEIPRVFIPTGKSDLVTIPWSVNQGATFFLVATNFFGTRYTYWNKVSQAVPAVSLATWNTVAPYFLFTAG